jgi:drug/metabolite transporter (DMT)-like permease
LNSSDQRIRNLAILSVILGELCFAVMGAIIKHLAPDLVNEVIVFYRNFFAFLLLLPLILMKDGVAGLRTRNAHFHLMRGTFGVASMACFFFILGRMQFTEAILLKLTTPFFIPLLAFLWLKERSSRQTLSAIVLGFIGVICIIDPAARGFSALDLVGVGLAGAVLAALAKVTIRRMSVDEPSRRIVFYFSLVASALSFPFAWAHWQNLTWPHIGYLVLLALVATIGQLLITAAYRRAPAGKIGQYAYTSLIFSSMMGWYFWDEILTLSIALGCLFIVGAGVLNLKSR